MDSININNFSNCFLNNLSVVFNSNQYNISSILPDKDLVIKDLIVSTIDDHITFGTLNNVNIEK